MHIAITFLTRRKKQTIQDNALLTLGTALVAFGIIFGDDRLLGYSFIEIRVLLSIICAVIKLRNELHALIFGLNADFDT